MGDEGVYTKKDRDGNPLTNLSLAYPKVRRYWLSLIWETMEYGVDGVQLNLNRSTPFIIYEKPVVETFEEKYGADPRKLPGDDLSRCGRRAPRNQR